MPTPALALAFVLAAPIQAVQGGPGGPPAGGHALSHSVRSLGLAVTDSLEWGPSGLAVEPVLVPEAGHGATDLNGDGDTLDRVLHVVDPQTGQVTNLGFATISNQFAGAGVAGRFTFLVLESEQGGADLNGDGDALDVVAFVHDVASGTSTSTGHAVGGPARLSSSLVVLSVSESNHGGADLNGDGDAFDNVLHVLELSSGTVTNLGLAVPLFSYRTDGDLVAFLVDEFLHGQDLDGDGQLTHKIAHVYDHAQGLVFDLGVHTISTPLPTQGKVAYGRQESLAGDLNGDGDSSDNVLQVFDVGTQAASNTGLALGSLSGVCGPYLLLTVNENAQGVDLNGDGKLDTFVLHALHLPSGGVQSSAVAFVDAVPQGAVARVDLSVYEKENGADLDGDGDQDDVVVEAWDLVSNQRTSTGLSSGFVDQDALFLTPVASGVRYVAVADNELAAGTDLDGDGDTDGATWRFYDSQTGLVSDPGLGLSWSSGFGAMGDDLALVLVDESAWGGRDLNGDGDVFDRPLAFWDAVRDRSVVLPFAATTAVVHGRRGLFLCAEGQQGSTDLNGDGDANDLVLMHLAVP